MLIRIALPLLLFFFWTFPGYAGEGIEWNRLRLRPKLSIAQGYSDNVFRTESDEKEEFITAISPDLAIDFAFAPRNILTLSYEGELRLHKNYDNFKKDHHLGSLTWNWTMPRDSTVELGANILDSAIQPFSEDGRAKDFVRWQAFGGGALKLKDFPELGLRYNHTSRNFDSSRDEQGDFDRDSVTLDMLYRRLPRLPLLLEYYFAKQDNNDPTGPSTDSITHRVLGGARWDPAEKLTGHLKLGYEYTDYKEVEDFSGFSTDTDLIYRFSEITTFKLRAYRWPVRSTRAARETGAYYILTGGSLTATHRRWHPLAIALDFTYRNKDFQQGEGPASGREDNLFKAGILGTFYLKETISFSLGYQYRRNDSNFDPVDYRENLFEFRFSISL